MDTTTPPPVTTPQMPHTSRLHSRGVVLALITVVLLVGGYVTYAYFSDAWPFAPAEYATEWKTYTNSQYGFELAYPATATVQEDTAGTSLLRVEFLAQPRGGFQMSLDQAPVDTSCFVSLGAKTVNTINWSMNRYTCGIGSDNDLKFAATTARRDVAYTIFSSDKTQAELDQILSTFKFTTPNTTADWKTYLNTQYGFRMSYPATYYLLVDSISPQDPDVVRALNQGLPPETYLSVVITDYTDPNINKTRLQACTEAGGTLNSRGECSELARTSQEDMRLESQAIKSAKAGDTVNGGTVVVLPSGARGIRTDIVPPDLESLRFARATEFFMLFDSSNNKIDIHFRPQEGIDTGALLDQVMATFKFTK